MLSCHGCVKRLSSHWCLRACRCVCVGVTWQEHLLDASNMSSVVSSLQPHSFPTQSTRKPPRFAMSLPTGPPTPLQPSLCPVRSALWVAVLPMICFSWYGPLPRRWHRLGSNAGAEQAPTSAPCEAVFRRTGRRMTRPRLSGTATCILGTPQNTCSGLGCNLQLECVHLARACASACWRLALAIPGLRNVVRSSPACWASLADCLGMIRRQMILLLSLHPDGASEQLRCRTRVSQRLSGNNCHTIRARGNTTG